MVDPIIKSLIEANSAALNVLLAKIASGEPVLAEEIASVVATDANLSAALVDEPIAETPPPAA